MESRSGWGTTRHWGRLGIERERWLDSAKADRERRRELIKDIDTLIAFDDNFLLGTI